MKWLLLTLFLRGHGSSLTTQTFDTERQCREVERQIALMVKEETWIASVKTRCLPIEAEAPTAVQRP